MTELDGRAIAADLAQGLVAQVVDLHVDGIVPSLAMLVVGDDPAGASYARVVERAAGKIGLTCAAHRFSEDAATGDVLALVHQLNQDPSVHGIVLQTPLPPGINATEVSAKVAVAKDVDAINPITAGRMLLGLPGFVPATAAAVMEILHRAAIPIRGARAVVLGRSIVVGKPTAVLLLREDATVTLCHSKTANLARVAAEADILVVAIGQPRFVGAGFVKPGATVIDVGTNYTDSGVAGDVDYEAVAPRAGAITPVPGGVGPVTTMMLLQQVVTAAENAMKHSR